MFCFFKMLAGKFSKNLVRFLNLIIFLNFIFETKSNQEQAAATPIYLATLGRDQLSDYCYYWNNLVEGSGSEESQDSVLAYRLWEISESILIDTTSSFDYLLATGDQLSSFRKIDTKHESIQIDLPQQEKSSENQIQEIFFCILKYFLSKFY